MKIHLAIGELVLHGFEYHDHRRIGIAIEQELATLIRDNGLPGKSSTATEEYEIIHINAGSFNAPVNMNPKIIGIEVARSIYRGLEQLTTE
jgi:hypothetical protein